MNKGKFRKDVFTMNFHLDLLEDKIEFFEASDLKNLEKKIASQIEINKAILLSVNSVSHQTVVNENGHLYHTAVVHFKLKK
jgi:hypothetical protein